MGLNLLCVVHRCVAEGQEITPLCLCLYRENADHFPCSLGRRLSELLYLSEWLRAWHTVNGLYSTRGISLVGVSIQENYYSTQPQTTVQLDQ